MVMKPLDQAISIIGSVADLAKLIGVSVQAVYTWKAGRELPAEHCPIIERATKGAIRCEDLRPDVQWAYLRGTKKKAA